MATLSLFPLEEADPGPAPRHVVTTIQGDNSDLIAEVARLYLPEAACILDLTYGQGVFWRKMDLRHYTFVGADKEMATYVGKNDRHWQAAQAGQGGIFGGQTPRFLTYDYTTYAYHLLPFPAQALDVVVLDPPYMHDPHGDLHLEDRYRNVQTTGGKSHADILRDDYCVGLHTAWHFLRPRGTVWVKGKDEIVSGKQCRSHVEVLTAAKRLGFTDQELFHLLPTTVQAHTMRQRQLHARKNQSWLWVFRRPRTTAVPKRGRPKKGSGHTTIKQQRGTAYWAARLLRERPDLHARYMAGELPSVHAAAKLMQGR
jgi:hypothetical protein